MLYTIISILISLIIYGIVINKIHSGRCSRYEYFIKTLIIIGSFILYYIIVFLHSVRPNYIFGTFVISGFIILPILLFMELKWTIQRLYDLDLSGWYILLTWIPVFSIIFTIYLFIKKGKNGINNYDKAINYKLFLKGKNCIDIYDNDFYIDDEIFQYERYLGKYTIKISNYSKENIFTEYLLKNYQINEDSIYKNVEITKEDFYNIINKLNIIKIIRSFYLETKTFKIFIRKEDFNYLIIIDKNINSITKDLYETFDFPGSYYEDEKNIYYSKINKEELIAWINNVA